MRIGRCISSGLLVVWLLFIAVPPVEAQFAEVLGQTLAITLDPQFPQPGDRVTATLDDYSVNMAGGTITWRVDGAIATSSANSRTYVFTAPILGESLTVAVAVTNPRGETLTASRTVTPNYLDLIIEPQTFTPQFYDGRALPTIGSQVRITALLHDQNGLVNPAGHTYTWQLNNRVLNGGPVRGGFQTTYTVPMGDTHIIGVDVLNPAGRLIARRLFSVPADEVDVQLYEVSQLYGIKERVSERIQITGTNLTLRAMPYNLDLRALRGNVARTWKLDGRTTVSNSTDPYEITLTRSGLGQGIVEFSLRNRDDLLQGDEARVVIGF